VEAEVVMAEAEAGVEQPSGGEAVCGICFDAPEPPESLAALRCGHAFCTGCWGELLRVALEAGGKGLLAACPQPGCAEPLSGEAWAAWLPPSVAPLLHRLTLRSFVEGNTLLCWCPGAGCARAVALVSDAAPPEVFCECGAYYCARCSHTPHWPATCEQRRKWEETLNSSPDVQYLRQHTRPCPSCDVRTQRAEGCMHITCSNCGVAWCWACGESGRGVHHAFACSKRPDPKWKYQQEELRLLDGSFASALDAALLRQEQYDALSEAPRPPPPLHDHHDHHDHRDHRQNHHNHHNHPAPPTTGPAASAAPATASQRGLPPPPSLAALVPTLLRALRVCKWAQVYTFYAATPGVVDGAAAASAAAAGGAAAGGVAAGGAAVARLRLALGQLEECTDWLLVACDADGRRGAVDWAALSSDEGCAKSEWLVVTILYIYSHAAA